MNAIANKLTSLAVGAVVGVSFLPGPLQAQDKTGAASAQLGMLNRIPADSEGFIGYYNLSARIKELKGSNFMKSIEALILREAGAIPWEEPEVGGILEIVDTLLGDEFFVSFAKGSSKQAAALAKTSNLVNRLQYEMMFMGMRAGDPGGPGGGPIPPQLKAIIDQEGDKILKILEAAELPPMMMGFKLGEDKQKILDQIEMMEAELPEIVNVSEIEVAGLGKFKSWTFAAKSVLGPDQKAEITEALGPKMGPQVIDILSEKVFEACYGMVGEYLLVSLGSNHAHLKLADPGANSLAAAEEIQTFKSVFSKKLMGVFYASKGLQESLNTGDPLTPMLTSLVTGLKRGGVLNDTVQLTKELTGLSTTGNKLFSYSFENMGAVMYWDKGLHLESVGGSNSPSVDLTKPLDFSPLISDSTFIGIDAVGDVGYQKLSVQYLEELSASIYEGIQSFSKGPDADQEMKEMVEMADKEYVPQFKELWAALNDISTNGLGAEGAILVDLKGSLPKIPNTPLPTAILKNGKMPRVAFIYKVKDRAAIGKAWERMVPAATSLLKKIPTDNGEGVPFPDFLTSEKDGLTTYFYPFPFTSNDFLPSVSISDELMLMSTSKNYSEQLAAQYNKNKAKKPLAVMKGVLAWVDFRQAHALGHDWLKLYEENLNEIYPDNDWAIQSFKRDKPNMLLALDLFSVLKTMKFRHYLDGTRPKSSFYLKVEDMPKVHK